MTTTRKMRPATRRQGPQALLALSQLALDHMEQGVCVYDADNRIVLLNRRYLELFDMSADIVRQGTNYREVLAHSASRGNLRDSEIEQLYCKRLAQIAAGRPFCVRQRLASGLVMALELKPLAEGGWMTICDDITRFARLEAELRVQTQRSQHALANMSHALVMYDADGNLIVCNHQYVELYDLDPEIIKPGISHRELVEHWLSRGNSPGTSADEFHDNRMKEVRRQSPSTTFLTRYDGRITQAVSRFLPEGGWVTAHED